MKVEITLTKDQIEWFIKNLYGEIDGEITAQDIAGDVENIIAAWIELY